MSRKYKETDFEEKLLRIKPEGWVDELVLEFGWLHSSGQAEKSIEVRINDNAGGVLTNDALVAIAEMISNHFDRLSKLTQPSSKKAHSHDSIPTHHTGR